MTRLLLTSKGEKTVCGDEGFSPPSVPDRREGRASMSNATEGEPKMAPTYAIADLHGRFDLFTKAVAEITRRGGGKVVFLGDYVDRGPQSREIIEALMAGPPDGQEWICLKGNHEDMMAQTILEPLDPDWWLSNGGAATVRSYNGKVWASDVDWVNALPLYHATEHHLFVHAGGDETVPLAQQTEKKLCWFRCPRNYNYGIDGLHVVHGHTPFEDGPICLPSRTNLDTYAVGTGRLVIGVFDETAGGGPVETITVRGEPA